MKIKIDIEFDVSKDQAIRFARIFRYMNLNTCRVYASNDNEAVLFLAIIDNILSELKKSI